MKIKTQVGYLHYKKEDLVEPPETEETIKSYKRFNTFFNIMNILIIFIVCGLSGFVYGTYTADQYLTQKAEEEYNEIIDTLKTEYNIDLDMEFYK